MGYPLALAARYLASKKRNMISISTLLAVAGVALGVAALAIVMSVTRGFRDEFREKVLGVNAHVLVLKWSADFREYRDVMAKVEKVPGVIGIAPFVINPTMVTKGERTATGVLLKGVDPELMPRVLDLPKQIVEGSLVGLRRPGAKPPDRSSVVGPPSGPIELPDPFLDPDLSQENRDSPRRRHLETPSMTRGAASAAAGREEAGREGPAGPTTPVGGFRSKLPDDDSLPDWVDPDPCKDASAVEKMPGLAMGIALARQLDIKLGDCLQVTSPTIGVAYASSSRPPVAKRFRVIAFFQANFDQYDSKLVYADLYEAQAFYEYGDSVTGVEMKVSDIDKAREISAQIEKILGNPIYHMMDWRQLNHGLFTALLVQQIIMSIVLGIIIIVAAFQVIATLTMIGLEKKREISLLKALGANNMAILRVFLYQGAFFGIAGTGLGLALGYLGCKGLLAYGFPLDSKVYFISKLPVAMRSSEFMLTGAIALVICLAASVLPALYAASLRPSDGLRSE